MRAYLADDPRPINHTKTYGGGDVHWTDGDEHGIERFWRNLLGGAASVRFHRPPSGIGLNERAQTQIRSARMLLDEFNIFRAMPNVKSELLLDRKPDEAYLSRIPGESYALYFPDGGSVRLDLSEMDGSLVVQWLDIEESVWRDAITIEGGRPIDLTAPGEGNWAVVVEPN